MSKIHVLDKSIYELIAAGEVIERPSSVIKEMMENSIDAGATSITVEIKNGGRTYMRITDNGCGIAPEDIPLAFVRHATSKIETSDDLNGISTLGFRGEALASVCAVSKVEVLTKQKGSTFGSHYAIESSVETECESIGCPDGTTFIIRDLFYNVPARLKFLKKDVSEGNAIAGIVNKIALSHPEISFRFIRDNKTELITSGDGNLLGVIRAVFGKDFYSSCLPVSYSYNGVEVSGYVTKPLMCKANRAYQNFFVNSRYVKSITCMVALEEAYRNRIMTGKFPGCVLFVNVNPDGIDVNVHPAKVEIRFSDEKTVYDAVYFGVQNALLSLDKPTQIAFEPKQAKPVLTPAEIYAKPMVADKGVQLSFASEQESVSFIKPEPIKPIPIVPPVSVRPTEKPVELAGFKDISGTFQKPAENITPLPEIKQQVEPINTEKFKYLDMGSFANNAHIEEAPKPVEEPPNPNIRVVGEVFKTYIICEVGDDMYLIDKHAAHERHNFEKLVSGMTSFDSQTLLDPINIRLSYEAYDALADNMSLCKRMGFSISLLDSPNIVLQGVPVVIADEDPTDLLIKFSDSLALGKVGSGYELFDDLFHSIACKASIKANSDNDKLELEELAKLVFDEDIRYCPHGRPVLIKIGKYDIEKMFKRIV